MILLKVYRDVNGELVRVVDGSFQDLDSIAAGLVRVPGADIRVSADELTNLDLDSKLDDSQLIDDDSFGTATATNIPSAESVKAYVDAQILTKDEASEISFDGTASGLTSTNVQSAIDELDLKNDSQDINITNAQNDIDELELNQDDLIALSGVAENSSDLGTFTGATINDNVTIKSALQQLETGLENISSTIRVSDVSVVADIAARDAIVGADEGDVAKVLDADGNGNPETFIYDGAAWISLKSDDLVDSVNGQIGNVVLTTDEVSEGGTNLYHTTARARAAAVVNSTAGSETDQAPSVNAIKTYITTQLATQDEASEISYDGTSSGLAATDTQAAIDELDGRLDTIEGSTYVNSFNGRTGVVVPTSSDYDADQVDYDDSVTSLGATDVQGAIEALAALQKEYLYANQTVTQSGIDGNAVTLIYDNEAKNSNGTVFSLNTTLGEVTINKTSTYKIDYRATSDTDDGARRTTETILEVDNGSGYAPLSASVGSAAAYAYNRNNASGENTAAAQVILDITSGTKVRIRVRRSSGSGIVKTVPSGTSISIEEK